MWIGRFVRLGSAPRHHPPVAVPHNITIAVSEPAILIAPTPSRTSKWTANWWGWRRPSRGRWPRRSAKQFIWTPGCRRCRWHCWCQAARDWQSLHRQRPGPRRCRRRSCTGRRWVPSHGSCHSRHAGRDCLLGQASPAWSSISPSGRTVAPPNGAIKSLSKIVRLCPGLQIRTLQV